MPTSTDPHRSRDHKRSSSEPHHPASENFSFPSSSRSSESSESSSSPPSPIGGASFAASTNQSSLTRYLPPSQLAAANLNSGHLPTNLPSFDKSSSLVGPRAGGFTASQFAQHERRLREAVPTDFVHPNPSCPPPIHAHVSTSSWSDSSFATLDEKHSNSSLPSLVEDSNIASFRSETTTSSQSQSDGINSWPRGGYSVNLIDQYLITSHQMPPTKPQQAALKSAITFLTHVSKGSDSSVGHPSLGNSSKSLFAPDSLSSNLSAAVTVPEKRQGKFVRNVRHIAFSVYRRLFSIVFVLNIVALIVYLIYNPHPAEMKLSDLSTAASANILVAILIRQDYLVNLLYRTCWLVPLTAPIRLRRMLAKIYEHGGVHSGAAVCGTIWLILLTVVLTINFANNVMRSAGIMTVTYILLLLLILIIVFAFPRFRFMSHNSFEVTHRFAGWLAVALFWVELCLVVDQLSSATKQSFGITLIREPTFWFLVIITFHIILPWLRLRQWEFQPEVLSSHALRLRYNTTLKPFSGLAISDKPLFEWHPFATFPQADGEAGGSLIISNAGDWTKKTIQNPKTKYWVKGVPRTGVLSMAIIFRRVVVVTTGSGIGPCLSFLVDKTRRQPARVLWSTPSPLKTFGQEICDTVRSVDPNAIIHDTRVDGRPNMVEMAYQMYLESQAEAIFVISNPRLTRKIVYAMESRGVPAYGPIWDS